MSKLHVSNLPDPCTNAELLDLFSSFGTVTECEIIRHFAFVHFEDPEAANAAVEGLNGVELGGKSLVVQKSNSVPKKQPESFDRHVSTKLHISNLPDRCRRDQLLQLFEQCGQVAECEVIKDYAFVHYPKPSDSRKAVELLHLSDFNGKTIKVQFSHSRVKPKSLPMSGGSLAPERSSGRGRYANPSYAMEDFDQGLSMPMDSFQGRTARSKKPGMTTKLFVTRFPSNWTADDLYNMFQPYGRVAEADIIKDFGFVHMVHEDDALLAIQGLSGTNHGGQIIKVELSKKGSGGRPVPQAGGFEYDYPQFQASRPRSYGGMRSSGSGYSGVRSLASGLSTKLHVSNLPRDCYQEELLQVFQQYGIVTECEIIKDYAFVHYNSEAEAEDAMLNADLFDIRGSRIRIQMAKSTHPPKNDLVHGGGGGGRSSTGQSRSRNRSTSSPPRSSTGVTKLFVGNVHIDVTSHELRDVFEAYGSVVSCDVLKNYGFVHMSTREEAIAAVEGVDGVQLHGEPLRVEISTNQSEPKAPRSGNRPERNRDEPPLGIGGVEEGLTTKLHIGSLPTYVSSGELSNLFARYGTIYECEVVKDYGFVHFIFREQAEQAVRALNGFIFKGHRITVQFSNNRGKPIPRDMLEDAFNDMPAAPSTDLDPRYTVPVSTFTADTYGDLYSGGYSDSFINTQPALSAQPDFAMDAVSYPTQHLHRYHPYGGGQERRITTAFPAYAR